jgi:threonine dehydrogenase-like Zn-dependent dehydrogenase
MLRFPIMSDAHAFWMTAPMCGEIRPERLPPPRPGDAVVRTLYSGISRGTESLVYAGRVPPSEHERMRDPFQDGEFPFPVKYGYSSVGVVEQGPAALLGRLVFCLYPHQTRYVVPSEALHVLPTGVEPARAVLAANLETAINGLWDASPRVGDRIAVVGGGTVGCLVAWLASRVPGCRVELVDVNPARRTIAARLGAGFATPAEATEDVDLVVHASGAPDGLATALRLAGPEATIVEMSWFGDREVAIPLGGAFHARRLTLRSSQVGGVPPLQRPRWTLRRRMDLALALLDDPLLDVLITGESEFATLPATMARLSGGDALCHRIAYPNLS